MNDILLQEMRQTTASFFAERRKCLGITQMELAEMMGVNHSTIVRLEQGKFYIRQDILFKLCFCLNLTPFFVSNESSFFKQFEEEVIK